MLILSQTEAVNLLKKFYPSLRRTRSTAIIHSGGKRTIFGCVCGARHTCATSYRDAKHVYEWRKIHSECAEIELCKHV